MDTALFSLCDELGVQVTASEAKMNIRPLIKLVMSRYCKQNLNSRIFLKKKKL